MNKKTNFKKIKLILVGFLISIIALPTIAFGGSFVSSLVQGKTVEEAVQILAIQIDSLIGRVEQIEQKQQITQAELEKAKACNDYNRILAKIKDTCGIYPYPGINGCIWSHEFLYFLYSNPILVAKHVSEGNRTEAYWKQEAERQLKRLDELKELQPQYVNTAKGCGISLEDENKHSKEYIAKRACRIIEIEYVERTSPKYFWLRKYCKKIIPIKEPVVPVDEELKEPAVDEQLLPVYPIYPED